MKRMVLVASLLLALNNTVACMTLTLPVMVKSRTTPANLRISCSQGTPAKTIAPPPTAKSLTIITDLEKLRISDPEEAPKTDIYNKKPIALDPAQQQLQDILHETKAQLLLCLFLSLHNNVDKKIWATAPFERTVKNKVHPDLFASLSNFTCLTDCRIESDRFYSSWLSIETPILRRWIANALIEITITLDAIIGTDSETPPSEEREFFKSLIAAYQKSPDFSHAKSPNFNADQLLMLLKLNKSLMNTCFAGKLRYQADKQRELLDYCSRYCEKIDPEQLVQSLSSLIQFNMNMYELLVKNIAAN